MSENIFDCAIIGAGPVGLFAAYYAGVRTMSTVVVESLATPGGQLSTLYPEKYIYDVGGFPKIKAQTLVDQLVEQAAPYRPVYRFGERAEQLQVLPDSNLQLTTTRSTILARSLIIAAGVGAFEPTRLDAEGVDIYEDKGVYYAITDLEPFHDQNVLVIGGGDTALDYALMLLPVARSVTLIHRRDVFRAQEDSLRKLRNSNAQIFTFHELRAITGDTQQPTEAIIFDNRSGAETILPVSRIVIGLGFKSKLGPIAQWGLELAGNKIKVDSCMRTNLPGVYACGDIVTYEGKLDLIATGFGEAPIAVNQAKHYLDPKARVFPGHSSNREERHQKELAQT